MSKRKSEFGRGYATCLRQFVNHRARLGEDLATYQHMALKHADLFDEASAVEMWANGASDHLYELVKPKRGVTREEWESAQRLAARALDIGHGFRPTSKSNAAEAIGLLDAAESLLTELSIRGNAVDTLEGAMKADRFLGLAPIEGSWSCPVDLVRAEAQR